MELTIEDVAVAAHDISGIMPSKAIADDMIERFVRTFEPQPKETRIDNAT